MPRIKINKDKCKGCELCIIACPRKLLSSTKKLNKRGVQYVEFISDANNKTCTGCAMCALVCPDMCIEVYK